MKGKNVGVQKKILEKYPRARYNPCASHSLNLLVNDAAEATGATLDFFSFVNHIFVFLSGSTNRWDILRKHLINLSNLTVKPICTTRWPSRIDAMKPLRHNIDKIIAALKEIHNSKEFDAKTRHKAICIVDKIDYVFLCCVNVWYDILFQINITSNALQSVTSNVQIAMTSLENLMTYLQVYEQYNLINAIEEAKEMAGINEIEREFEQNKRQPESRQYRTTFEAFKKDFVLHIVEVATESANDRFDDNLFSFLYDFQNFENNTSSGKLNESCKRLANALTENDNADIGGEDLCREFPIVATLVKNERITHAIDILNLIKKK